MKVLVTGANGYIGRHVVEELLRKKHVVFACDVCTNRIPYGAEIIEFDIFNQDGKELYERVRPDVCIHLAWRNGFVHNADTHMSDISSHYKFLTSLIEIGLKHLVVMGSMHEVGYHEGAIDEKTSCNPLSQYAIAKDALRRSMMLYCQNHDVILQWLRGFYILGDDKYNNSIFAKLLKAEEDGKRSFPFTMGKSQYDFLSVFELAHQIVAVSLQNKISGIINCCSGKPVSLADRVEQFIKDNHLSIKLEYGVYPDRPYDSPCIYGDASKIKSILDNVNE